MHQNSVVKRQLCTCDELPMMVQKMHTMSGVTEAVVLHRSATEVLGDRSF